MIHRHFGLASERFDRLSEVDPGVGITDKAILDTLVDKIFDKTLTKGHYMAPCTRNFV
jgi:hypothetical protein